MDAKLSQQQFEEPGRGMRIVEHYSGILVLAWEPKLASHNL